MIGHGRVVQVVASGGWTAPGGVHARQILLVRHLVYIDGKCAQVHSAFGHLVAILVGPRICQTGFGIGFLAAQNTGPCFNANGFASKVDAGTLIVDETVTVIIDFVAQFFGAGKDGSVCRVTVSVGPGKAVAILVDISVTEVPDAIAIDISLVFVCDADAIVTDVAHAILVAVRLQRIRHFGTDIHVVGDAVAIDIATLWAGFIGARTVFVDAVVADFDNAGANPWIRVIAVSLRLADPVAIVVDVFTTQVFAVTVLIDAIATGLEASRAAPGVAVIAVAFGRAVAISVVIGFATG
jgi:hypothetical protein